MNYARDWAIIIPRFDWKGSDNGMILWYKSRKIIPRFDWKGSDNREHLRRSRRQLYRVLIGKEAITDV